MGEAEDAYWRRALQQEWERKQAESERLEAARQQEACIRAQSREEIPRALGRLASLGYPGSIMLNIYRRTGWFTRHMNGIDIRPAESLAVWYLGRERWGYNSRQESDTYASYYLASTGQIAIHHEHLPTKFQETVSKPEHLAAIQSLGLEDTNA